MRLHNLTRDKRVCDRIRAIIHCSNGWLAPQIAEALLIHETTVTRHINELLATGKLKSEKESVQADLILDNKPVGAL